MPKYWRDTEYRHIESPGTVFSYRHEPPLDSIPLETLAPPSYCSSLFPTIYTLNVAPSS